MDCIAVRSSHPSGTGAPVQGRGGYLTCPQWAHLDKGTCLELTRDVQDLDDDQLWEMLEALQMETARRKGAAHPHGHLQDSLRVPGGSSEANTDDGEVGLRGGDGAKWAYTAAHKSPHADVDVGHLLSTLTAGLRMGTPRVNTFSDDATPWKTEVFFEQWYHEVQCIKNHYLKAVVQESIIQSLKGQQQIWAGTWGPQLPLSISCKNLPLFLAWWPPLTFSYRICHPG